MCQRCDDGRCDDDRRRAGRTGTDARAAARRRRAPRRGAPRSAPSRPAVAPALAVVVGLGAGAGERVGRGGRPAPGAVARCRRRAASRVDEPTDAAEAVRPRRCAEPGRSRRPFDDPDPVVAPLGPRARGRRPERRRAPAGADRCRRRRRAALGRRAGGPRQGRSSSCPAAIPGRAPAPCGRVRVEVEEGLAVDGGRVRRHRHGHAERPARLGRRRVDVVRAHRRRRRAPRPARVAEDRRRAVRAAADRRARSRADGRATRC